MKSSLISFLLAFLLVCCGGRAQAQTPPTGFTSTTVSAGWNEAVGLTFNSSGSKMFVWERPGKVWVVVNGQRQQLLDITEEVGAWEDQGLLGFALDPNFDTNGYMYLLYVVDRHYLLNFGTASYSATANDYYSATIGRLTRYTATPSGTGYTVNPASRRILIGSSKTNGIPSTFNGHVTAALQFGSDGTLLVATGDGAHPYPDFGAWTATYAPQALADGIITAKEDVGSLRAQLVDCYNGKILRLDPSNGNGVASNPYYDATNPGAPRSKVWALGFRNPFRMTLKPGTGSTDPTMGSPGTIYLGDVGAASWEEVDVVSGPRQNFGWPLFEGLTPYDAFTTSNVYNRDAPNPLYNSGGCTKQFFYFQDLIKQATPTGTATFPNSCNPAQTVPAGIPTFVHVRPLIDWNHTSSGPSRTGTFSGSTATTSNLGAAGSPVAGSQFGGSASTGGGFYPYSDFPVQYRNTYFFGDYVGGWIRNLTTNSSNQPSAVGNFVPSGAVPVAFATSPGETGLFYVNFYPSEIRKISYVTTASPPVAVATSNKTYGPGPLTVQFTGSASTDPNGSPLTYSWNFGDGTATSSAANPSHTFSPPTSAATQYTVTLTVTNAQGLSNQATIRISANNTPPQVTITSPAAGTQYLLTGNTTYQLRATVVDAEQSGHLLSYQWQTILHHASHEHPDPVDTTRQTSTTIVPYGCGTETYYYRILLTVTDAGGLATTQEVRLDPNCNATSFTLVDADADVDIQALTNGAILNLAMLPTRNLNIRANANPATTGSVVFALSGAQVQNQTESVTPYALFSDVNGNYNPWTPPVGNYSLTATPYSGSGGSGTPGAALSISFSVTDTGTPGPFTLTTAVFGSGTIAKSPDQSTYANGTSVTLTAAPAAGFAFTGWSGAATGTTNPLTVTMNANKSITATFTATSTQQVSSYTLVNADSNADIQTLTAGQTLNLATLPTRNLNVRANTNPSTVGSVIFALSGAQTQNQTESVAPYALFSDNGGAYNPWTPPVGSYSLTATPFTAAGGGGTAGTPLTLAFTVIDQATTTYTLTTAVVGSGTVTRNPNTATYASGSSVTLTAAPAAGFTFTGWSGGATGTTNPLLVTMTANKSITATFTAITTYTLTVTTSGSGSVTKTPNQTSYASGSTVSLTATPAAGYRFSGWSGGATGTTNPLSVTMTANKSITATFVVTTTSYTLTTAVVGSGTVAKSPNQSTYLSGTSVTLTATPAAGFAFTGWSGGATGITNPLTVVMTANKSITATFTATTTYTLTTVVVGSGTVTRNPNTATYASGSSVTLTAAPAAGFAFTGWSGAATGTTNPLTVTMTANKSITATFTATTGPQVTALTLVNADTDLDIQPLTTGAVLNLAALPTANLTIRATTSPATVGSVLFVLGGTQAVNHNENLPPYALFADSNGDYNPWTPAIAVGSYTLTTTAYPAADNGGTAGPPLSISFTVTNQAARVAAAVTAAPARSGLAQSAATAYPNPSADGRFSLRLPEALQGAVRYRLLTALGATLATGTLPADAPVPQLDFSREINAAGLYYLLLENDHAAAQLKLLRQ